jgi:hypothetical protein
VGRYATVLCGRWIPGLRPAGHVGGGREPECRSPATREASPEASTGAPNYDQVAQLKTTYDPENVLHLNPNVKPAV